VETAEITPYAKVKMDNVSEKRKETVVVRRNQSGHPLQNAESTPYPKVKEDNVSREKCKETVVGMEI
jgi:hypothetical protein